MRIEPEDLSHPPESGRKGRIVLLGIVVPLVIAVFAARGWINEEAFWPGSYRRLVRGGTTVTGDAARALAVCYLSVAGFFHSRWFWGSLGEEKIFKAGIIISMIAGIVSGMAAFVLALA